jgi:predicted dehydrogenase
MRMKTVKSIESLPRESTNSGWTRREFLAAGLAAPLIIPRHVLGRTRGKKAPSDTLNIAAVGIGGVGQSYIDGCKSENIMALVDVDDQYAAPVFNLYPKAARYRDFRVMLEKEKTVDAVIIGTPDHSHAVIAMAAVKNGRHVYVAKPMTRTIFECRALASAARDAGVATQMSVQSCASDASCRTAEWLAAGAVGRVSEVHVWSDRPVWPQGTRRPEETVAVPEHLDWDLWLGPAPVRPYHPAYHPFNFRGWFDFGTGALGDMACHSLHAFFKVLKLEKPAGVCAAVSRGRVWAPPETADPQWTRSVEAAHPETFPASSIVMWDYPERDGLPPLRMYWYDGGLRPPVPPDMDFRAAMRDDGVIFIGDKGALLTGFTGGPMTLNKSRKLDFASPPESLPRTSDHYREWIDSCKGGKPAACNFDFARGVTEVALLGVIAQRSAGYLEWNSEAMCIANDETANRLVHPPYREGWSL